MLFPSAFYGSESVVSDELRPIVKSYLQSGKWPDSLVAQLINSNSVFSQGVKVAFSESEYLRRENHFQIYLLGDLLEMLRTAPFGYKVTERGENLFDSLIVHDWGFLCLLCKNVILPNFQSDNQRARQFFLRFMDIKEDLLSERSMYSLPGNPAQTQYGFWNLSFTNFFGAMVQAGVPKTVIQQNPPPIFSDDRIVEWIHSYIIQ